MCPLDLNLAYRDSRDQLTRRLGAGEHFPLAETCITTEHSGVFTNTPTIAYSLVGFDRLEQVYVHNPQENTTYALVDVETNEVVDSKTSKLNLHNGLQQKLTLTTYPIKAFERTFKIRATELDRGLDRDLDTVVKVRAGVNIDLTVEWEPTVLDFEGTTQITIRHAQADCEYWVVKDPFNGEELPYDYTIPEQLEFLSDSEFSNEVRDGVFNSHPLQENIYLRVYAKFRTSQIDGFLKTPIKVEVRPNTFLSAKAVHTDFIYTNQTLIQSNAAPNLIPVVRLLNSQESAEYTLYFDWTDPVAAKQTKDELASLTYTGTGTTPLDIPLNQVLPEDVVVRVEAENIESKERVVVKEKVRFFIYPSTHPTLHLASNSVDSGSIAVVQIHNPQVGAYYQLRKASNHHKVGHQHYFTKNRKIDVAAIEIDFMVAPTQTQLDNGEASLNMLLLPTDPITKEMSFYVEMTKPINHLPAIKLLDHSANTPTKPVKTVTVQLNS